jgi:hypothetical protein
MLHRNQWHRYLFLQDNHLLQTKVGLVAVIAFNFSFNPLATGLLRGWFSAGKCFAFCVLMLLGDRTVDSTGLLWTLFVSTGLIVRFGTSWRFDGIAGRVI